MEKKLLLNAEKVGIVLQRLCRQVLEEHTDFSNTVIIGLQPRGTALASRIHQHLQELSGNPAILYGELDIAFYRDDFRRGEVIAPSSMKMDFVVEGKQVILVDDVLYTGRTIRSALDALIDFGRPASVELLVLIDRKYSRQFPIQPDYVGQNVDTRANEKVLVQWGVSSQEDEVWLLTSDRT